MKLSEYIERLQAILDSEGDIKVTTSGYNGGAINPKPPSVEYTAQLKPRESVVRYWSPWTDRAKAHRVVRV